MRKLLPHQSIKQWAVLLLWSYCFVCATPSFCQHQVPLPFLEFEQITLPGGLQGNTVQCMAQDEYGFLWFGTVNGLTRYDGRGYRRYRHNPLDSNSLINDYVECLLIDQKGIIWIGSLGKGLTRFNPTNNTFKRYKPQRGNPNGLTDGIINTIIEEETGILWLGTNSGITRLDPDTEIFKHYKVNPNSASNLESERIRVLYLDKAGDIWAGAGLPWAYNPAEGGLYRLNPKTEEITSFIHHPNDPTSLSDNRVGAIFEDSKGNFWIGTMGSGLQLLDRATGEFTHFPCHPNNKNELCRPWITLDKSTDINYSQVSFIHEDPAKRLWIGAFYGGLNIYDPILKKQIHLEQNSPYQTGLTTNYVWDVLQTDDQTLFICTAGDGGGKTYKVNYKTNHFPFYQTEKEREVSYITEDKKGNIWLGFLDGKNLIKFNDLAYGVDKQEGLDIHHIEEIDRVDFPEEIKQCGSVLLQFTKQGIQLSDAQTNQVKLAITTDEATKAALKAHTVWIIQEDLNHDFWIASWGGGLYFIDSQAKTITNFHHNRTESTSIGGNYISHIFEDRKGNIWIAGGQKYNNLEFPLFIDKFEPNTKSFEHFVASAEQYGYVPSIAEDKEGNLWYPTTVDGIRKLNPKTKETTAFKLSNSLIPTDEIRALVIDHADKIWLSTENSIVKFDPQGNSFVVYGAADGIQIDNFGFGVGFLTATGQATFGGTDGFHIFDPLELSRKENFHQPTIQITELQINNEIIHPRRNTLLGQPIWKKNKLELNHQQNSFSFGINCLDYQQSNKVYLEYQLMDYDGIWRKAGSEKTATYVNVPSGTYTFKVRGANSKGYWNKEGKSIELIIHPPWWQTWWAIFSAILVFAGAIYVLYNFQLNRQRIEQEGQQLKEIDGLKTRLYGNITHEFRTPLTLIIGLAKQLYQQSPFDKSVINKLKTIERNGQKSLQLVNQLLDLRKLEVGQLTLDLVQGNISPLFRYIHDNFHSYAASKDLNLALEIPNQPIQMDYDANRIYEIVSNLVINAIKYTPEGGEIYLIIKEIKNNGILAKKPLNAPLLLIKVKDTGIGVLETDLPFIFDRFHQVAGQQNASGTGIGLALVKEFVELMNGVVQVKSIPNVGSEFDIYLPITNNAPFSDNILNIDFAQESIVNAPFTLNLTPQSDSTDTSELVKKEIILIVEDNEEVAQFVASFLQKKTIHFAKDGVEGMDKALAFIPDLIISDVMMPNKNGFELCDSLKGDKRTSHIPIILLTARASNTDRISGLKRGADAYLTKPFSDTELQLWVHNLLQTRKQLHQRYATLEVPTKSKETMGFDLTIEDAFVKNVIALIQTNCANPDYSVTLLAEAVHLSSSQLHRKITAVTGRSPIQLLRLHRLEKAKTLLKSPKLSISEIAYQSGFNDPSYFTRVFTKTFKMKPTVYREQYGT